MEIKSFLLILAFNGIWVVNAPRGTKSLGAPFLRDKMPNQYKDLVKKFKETGLLVPRNTFVCTTDSKENRCDLDTRINAFLRIISRIFKLKKDTNIKTVQQFQEKLLEPIPNEAEGLEKETEEETDLLLVEMITALNEHLFAQYESVPYEQFKTEVLDATNILMTLENFFEETSDTYKDFKQKEVNVYGHEADKKHSVYSIISRFFQYSLEHIGIEDEPEPSTKMPVSQMMAQIEKFYPISEFESEHALDNALGKMGVFLYTAEGELGGPWSDINKILRTDCNTNKLFGHLGFIMKGFERIYNHMPEYRSKTGTYYRGQSNLEKEHVDFLNKLEVGKSLMWPQFVSCSKEEQQAINFMKKGESFGESAVMFIFKFEDNCNAKAIEIEDFSFFEEEKEIMIWPYETFTFIGKKKQRGYGEYMFRVGESDKKRRKCASTGDPKGPRKKKKM